MSMVRRNRAFCIALNLGIALLLEGAWVPAVDAQSTPATGDLRGLPQLASAATSNRAARPRPRRRRRPATLRLPAATQYGIPRLHVKADYVVDTNNRVLSEKTPDRILPIATLTTLVATTALL